MMPAASRGEAHEGHEAGEVPAPLRGTWVGDELTRALRQIDALTHALDSLQQGMRLQQQEVARLSDGLQVVDGRSQRHEAGQDIARALQQEIVGLRASLEAETELRRDLAGRVDRDEARGAATQRELQRVLEQIATRLDAADRRQASITEREQHLTADLADQARDEQTIEARLTDAERHVAAAQEATRHAGQEIARLAGAVPELLAKVEDLGARMRTMAEEQRRTAEDLSAVRAVRDREGELREVLEQQRATRARLEERLNAVEEEMEAVRRVHLATQDQIALLARDRQGDVEQRRRIEERLEAQRDTVAEHLRRALRADEERARRRIDEIERDVRVARSLLARLDERAGETDQEQPL